MNKMIDDILKYVLCMNKKLHFNVSFYAKLELTF